VNRTGLVLCSMAGWILVFFFEFLEMHKPIHNVLSIKVMPSVHERLLKALCNYNNWWYCIMQKRNRVKT